MPYDTKAIPTITALDQIIFCWNGTSDAISNWKTENMIAEKRRAITNFKQFFLLTYPALKSKKRAPEWEEWFKNTDFDNLKTLDLQLAFIDYCSQLMKYKIIPLESRKAIPKGGMEIDTLDEMKVDGIDED